MDLFPFNRMGFFTKDFRNEQTTFFENRGDEF